MRMFKFFRIGFFLVGLVLLRMISIFVVGGLDFDGTKDFIRSFFMFDALSFYFLILVIILGVYSQIFFIVDIDNHTRYFLIASLIFRGMRFIINHAILFWCFYELSMLPLLFLIFKGSPYSERFLAG